MNTKKRISYRFNRWWYKLRWSTHKWTRGYCRHFCSLCKYHDECCWTLWRLLIGGDNVSKVKTICICLPVDRVEELRATAAKLGISVSALVNVRLHMADKSQLNSAYGVEVLHYGEDND